MRRVRILLRRGLTAVDLHAMEQRRSVISYQLWSSEVIGASFQHSPTAQRFALEERAEALRAEMASKAAQEDLWEGFAPEPPGRGERGAFLSAPGSHPRSHLS